MSSKYFLLLVLTFLGTLAVKAQNNTPNLNVTDPGGTIISIPQPPILSIPTSNHFPAYIRTYAPKVPIINAGDINSSSNPANIQAATIYKDGFNRTIQSVQHYVLTGSRPHLVQPYDTRFQAATAAYLPYPASTVTYDDYEFPRQAYYYTNEAYPGEGYTSMSVTRNLSNSGQRATKTLAPGRSQIGQNRGTTIKKVTNIAGEVKVWESGSNGKPIYKGTYAAGRLFGELVSDTSGAQTLTYTDMDGKKISSTVKQKDQAVGGGGVITINGTTEYVYDIRGNLVCVMPPKASAAAGTGPNTSVLNNLCFQFAYDTKGRKIMQKFPGKAKDEYVYDKKSRVIFYQDGNLKTQGGQPKWIFMIYDALDRLILTGQLNTPESRQQLQSLVDDNNSYQAPSILFYQKNYELYDVYPTQIANAAIQTYTYYDNYKNTDPDSTIWLNMIGSLMFDAELISALGTEIPQRAAHYQGQATGSKVRILTAPGAEASKTGEWRESINYYDKKGRMIYTAGFDKYLDTTIHNHFIGIQYDFSGRLLISKHKMYNKLGQTQEHTERNYNEYDLITGNLLKSWHKASNSSTWNLQASYSYDQLGRLGRKVLGDYGEVQDYTYNIRGQLKGINEHYARTGERQGESRSFGQSLCYDYGFSQRRYDGKLSGMIWRGAGASLASAYGYDYDYSGRLTLADYRRYETSSSTWSNTQANYSLNKLNYDRDGNIEGMEQYGVKPGTGIVLMDQLSYTYENGGLSDRLEKVQDGATFHNLGDFNNTNGNGTDYGYDPNGNLTADSNKNINSISYTYFNKPEVITFGNGKTILYSYDANGNKVQELIRQPGNPDKRTDYVGNYVYENNFLRYVLTGEGRTVYDTVASRFKEEYFVKDNLGNVRSVVEVYVPPVAEYLAGHEVASANLEGLFFDHLNHDPKPGGSPGDEYASRLNGSDPNRRIGTSMLLKVMAGDKVEMNVNSYFEVYDRSQDSPVSAADMLSTIVTTLMTGSGGLPGETHDIHKVTDAFNSTNYTLLANLVNSNYTNSNLPKAYLNYVLFDESMKIVSTMSGAYQATGQGDWQQIGTITPLEIPQNGYLAVYLSNATRNISIDQNGNVFFDQVVIRFSRGKLKEEAHYYPHGLPIAGMGSAANGMIENRNKYQGNAYQQDFSLNWMDFNHRQYDPQIGRFLSVDPLASATIEFSPYAAMNNNPTNLTDPDGLQVGQNREYAWARRTALGSPIPDYVDSEWRGILEYLMGKRMEGGMNWDGGGSSMVSTRWANEVKDKFQEFMGQSGSNTGLSSNLAEVARGLRLGKGSIFDAAATGGANSFGLKDIENYIFTSVQYDPWDCGFYTLAVCDAFLGSKKGYSGAPRSVAEFKSLHNSPGDGIMSTEMGSLLDKAGMTYVKISSISEILTSIKNGYPVISGETGRGASHFVLIVKLTYNPSIGLITTVYDPGTGEITDRPATYFDAEYKGKYHHSTGTIYSIQKP